VTESSTPPILPSFNHTLLVNDRGDSIVSFAEMPQQMFDVLRLGFVPRSDDVFVVTYPRSGTTWTRQILHLLLNHGQQGDTDFHQTVPYLDYSMIGLPIPEHVEYLMGMDQQRYLTTHFPYNFMPKAGTSLGRYIYVARNPKDCAVSTYYFYLSLAQIGFDGSWEEFFELFIRGLVFSGDCFDHVLGWWQANQEADNILFLTYEGMHRDPAGTVAQIAHFIGVSASPEVIAATVEQTMFNAMRSNPKANMEDINVPRPEHPYHHLRNGQVGDWRNLFTPQQSARIDARYQEEWAKVGLTIEFA
jgi:hypothetical protein